MASYYYLISSLPDISSDGDLPMSYKEFIDMCRSNVSESKLQLLEDFSLSAKEVPIMRQWNAFYADLTGELNQQRSINLGRQYKREFNKDSENAKVAAAAIAASNPLEGEKLLLDYEFDKLDSLVGLHAFDDTALFGYAIKLKLLERLKSFVQEKGKVEFQNLFYTVQQRVYTL